MKVNKKQKRTVLVSILLIIIALIIWQIFGGEIFTKTEVLIKKYDELLGTSYKEWQEKFILGLDYTLAIIAVIVFVGSTVFYLQKSKNK